MKRLLCASVLAVSFGCGQATPPSDKTPASAVPVTPSGAAPISMVPVQQQVTRYDAQGRPYVATETVMVPVNTSAPAVRPVGPEPIRIVPGGGFVPGEKLHSIPKQKNPD